MANVWTSGGNLSAVRRDHAGFGSQSAAVASAGYDGTNLLNTTEEYDGSAWAAGGNAVVSYRQVGGAGSLTAGLLNGGFDGTNTFSSSSEYDGTSWTAGNAMVLARRLHNCFGTQVAAVVNGTIWSNNTEEYNGTSYFSANNSSIIRVNAVKCGTQTAGLVAAGQSNVTTYLTNSEEYDGTSWAAGGSISVGTRQLSGFGTQTAAVRSGGDTTGTSNIITVESYDGTSWTTENSISTARRYHGAAGDSTNGFIFGGDSASGGSSSPLLSTEEWTPAPILLVGSFAAQSGTSGALAMTRGLIGSFAAQSGSSGTLTAILSFVGSFAAQSGSSGSLTIITPGVVNLVGSFAAQSGTSGALAMIRGLTGAFAAQSGTSGTLTVTGASVLFGVSNFPSGVLTEYQITDDAGAVITAWTNTGVVEMAGPVKSGYMILTNAVPQDFQGMIAWRTPGLSRDAFEAINLRATATNMRGTDNSNTVAPDNTGIAATLAESQTHPTLAEIEASAVLAKEATSQAIKAKTDTITSGGGGGGGGVTDWTDMERRQLRHRLGIDGMTDPPATNTPNLPVDLNKISGDAGAAANLKVSAQTLITGQAVAGTLTTTKMTTDLTAITDGFYDGRAIIWASGPLKGQAKPINGYTTTGRMLVYSMTTEPPQAGDLFVIV